jgi:sugar lactone lactonase YvrE
MAFSFSRAAGAAFHRHTKERRGFALEGSDGSLRFLPELWSGPAVRMNEGGCDPDGRFYCGSDQLFITTSREGLPEGEDPLAGALFMASSQVVGLPAREFAG